MLVLRIFLMVLGFALLVKGADWFVDGTAGIAQKCKIPALVIGLTVVAFGTSAPELAVSVTSAVKHSTDLAIGNVVGSNIVNILLILGLSALLHELPVRKNTLRLDLPVLLLASLLLIGLGAWNYALEWWDGLILLAVFSVYMFLLFKDAFKQQKLQKQLPEETSDEKEEKKEKKKGKIGQWLDRMEEKLWFLIVLSIVGLGMVVGGGTLLVDSARYIAASCGVSERIIGLTIVAIGTSLPELVTSVIASFKGETDIAVGNIIGSNIFNIFIVAGIASLFCPLTLTPSEHLIDAVIALAAAVLLFALALVGRHSLKKPAGIIFLSSFAAYYLYLFLAPVAG